MSVVTRWEASAVGLAVVLALVSCASHTNQVSNEPALFANRETARPLPELGFLDADAIRGLGPASAIRSVGDIDGDGDCEVAFSTGDNSGRQLRICDSRTGSVLRTHESKAAKSWPIDATCIGDFDADGCDDYVVASRYLGPGGRLFRSRLESFSGESGACVATREFRGGHEELSVVGVVGPAVVGSDHPHAVALARGGRPSNKAAPWPTLVLDGANLETICEVPFSEFKHSYRGGMQLVDWRQDGSLELALFEFSYASHRLDLAFYSVASGELVETIHRGDLFRGGARDAYVSSIIDEEWWGQTLTATDNDLFVFGPKRGVIVALELETGQVRYERTVQSGVYRLGDAVPVTDLGGDGDPDLLLWGYDELGWGEWTSEGAASLFSGEDVVAFSGAARSPKLPPEGIAAPLDEPVGLEFDSGTIPRDASGRELLPHEISDHRRRRLYRVPPR